MTEMERRVAAVRLTMSHFAGKPFAWGRTDCAKVAAWHLRQMGHRVSGMGKAGTYKTPLGARRALSRLGHETLTDALGAIGLLEIAPAAALPGDIVVTPGTDGFEALTIVAGNGAVLGFHEDALELGLQAIRIGNANSGRAWRA